MRTNGYALMLGLLATGAGAIAGTRDATSAGSGSGPEVARLGTAVIRESQLEELAREPLARLRSEEYNIKRRVLDEYIGRLLMEQEAARRKVSVPELIRQEVEAKAQAVTGEEVKAAYSGARARFGSVPEEQALRQLEEGLRRQRAQQRRSEFLKELRARSGVRILLEAPRVAVEGSGGPAKGPADAPVTILEYSDFQCPYCSAVNPTLAKLEERYRGKVRIVFRHFPLPFHAQAVKAAEAASCAEEQGRFWEMHDKLFANQKALQATDLKRYAQELGLEPQAFEACLDSGRQAPAWQRGQEEGMRYGVTGTPSFFVNGRPLSGLQSYESFSELVEEELERVERTRAGRAAAKGTASSGLSTGQQ